MPISWHLQLQVQPVSSLLVLAAVVVLSRLCWCWQPLSSSLACWQLQQQLLSYSLSLLAALAAVVVLLVSGSSSFVGVVRK